MWARGTGAGNYSVHLNASAVQLFQNSLVFKVAILIVKYEESISLPRRSN